MAFFFKACASLEFSRLNQETNVSVLIDVSVSNFEIFQIPAFALHSGMQSGWAVMFVTVVCLLFYAFLSLSVHGVMTSFLWLPTDLSNGNIYIES
jgi:hypothetical protein